MEKILLRKAVIEDSLTYYNWVNDPIVREQSFNSPHKYKGVYKSGKSSWRMVCADVYYGVYKTEVDAAIKYNEIAVQIWGEFANINIIK